MTRLARRLLALFLSAVLVLDSTSAMAAVRLKDILDFEGVRPNLLVGYGLIVGLNGTGDNLATSVFTRESLIGMLERLGVNARDTALKAKNVAAVMVTATLPAFARQGSRLDVNISAMGDSNNLLGGTLVVTPLLGADGEVYAVAQGQLTVSGSSARGAGASITKGVPTAGKIPSGAIVERELPFDMQRMTSMTLALRNPDFTTASRVAQVINAFLRLPQAQALDSGTVKLAIPEARRSDIVGFLTSIEQLRVEPDQPARVVIDEANGVIVMGENVRISTVAVAQGSLTVKITETPQVSQPNALAPGGNAAAPVDPATGLPATPGRNGTQFAPNGGAATVVVPRTEASVDEKSERRLALVPQGVTIQELVNSLNALGIGPRDMMSILQTIKAAGALQADLETR